MTKRVHIYNCDYSVRKIEYFDDQGRTLVVAELDKYKDPGNEVEVPTVIRFVRSDSRGREESFRIRLDSVKAVKPFGRKSDKLFAPPTPRGFEHVYRIVDGEMVEETP